MSLAAHIPILLLFHFLLLPALEVEQKGHSTWSPSTGSILGLFSLFYTLPLYVFNFNGICCFTDMLLYITATTEVVG